MIHEVVWEIGVNEGWSSGYGLGYIIIRKFLTEKTGLSG
jgi:hypothetical protein